MTNTGRDRSMRGRAGLLVAALLAFVSGCTHAPWNPYRGWRAWKTNNVTVYADTVIAPSVTLEQLEDAYQILEVSFFRGFDVPPVEVIEIDPAADSPFVANGGQKKLEIAAPRLLVAGQVHPLLMVGAKSDRWQQTHVLAHHFVASALPGAPLWFHEGLATYLMGFSPSQSRPDVICFGMRRPGRTRGGVLEPLPALFSLTWKNFNEDSAPHMAFTAWGLVDYLLHGRDRALALEFRSFMIAAAAQKDGAAALRAAYPADVEANIAVEMPAHVRHVEEPNLCPLPFRIGSPRRPRTAPTVSPVPEATMKAFFDALYALPDPNGYADYFP